MSLADQSKALALALRYESRLRRIHERAFSTLRELQRERKMESANPESVDPTGTDDGGRGTEIRPGAKPGEGEQAPPAAAPAAQSTPRQSDPKPARCAPKKIGINEPTVRYALKLFHQPQRRNTPYAGSEAAR